jgi:hypothetical protein
MPEIEYLRGSGTVRVRVLRTARPPSSVVRVVAIGFGVVLFNAVLRWVQGW